VALTRADALDLDRADDLAGFRRRFVEIDPDLIYLDGNSLGRQPRVARDLVHREMERWNQSMVRGWGEGWYTLPQRLGGKVASLVGARPEEVRVCDSTSVNFFKLVVAALKARPERQRIVTDDLNFPSDIYLLQGVVKMLGSAHHLHLARSPDGIQMPRESIVDTLAPDTALLTLSHTSFKSAFMYDMHSLTALAHQEGALTLWDLSHSAGSVPVDLNGTRADLAVGCTYKYLNGGPGAPAFLYVRRDLQEELLSPIWGWFGEARPFEFGLDYDPAPGVDRFLAGTPPILAMIAVEAGVDLLIEAGMDAIRRKSVAMTEFAAQLWRQRLEPFGVKLKSPLDSAVRGSHIALGHPEAWRINQALIEDAKVIPDFRQPDNIRLGFAPLYNTFAEVFDAIERMHAILESRSYERFSPQMSAVT
jgi:kynureninase